MKFFKLLIVSLLSIIIYNCTHTSKDIPSKNYNINKIRKTDCANTKQSNSPLDVFHKGYRQDTLYYDLILQKKKTDFQNFGLLHAADIECIIPRTESEFSLFYNGYKNEKESKGCGLFYHYCDSLFSLYANRDSLNIFYVYLNMYRVMNLQVADETYCTNIFNRIEDAIYINKKKYDELYQAFDDSLKKTYSCFNWE